MGEPVDLEGAADFALSAAPLAAPWGVLVADLAVCLGESAALWDWPSFEVALEDGLRPALVGVLGALGVLPAAGEGAMLLDVRAVCGEGVRDVEPAPPGGEDRFGVGGKE